MHEVTDLFGAIVTLALVTTLVSHPHTADVFRAAGGVFSDSIKAATRF